MSFAARFIRESSAAGAPPPPPPTVELIDAGLSSIVTSPSTASFFYRVESSGSVIAGALSGSQNYTWLNSGSASDYEVRWVPSVGSLNPDTGTVNTWLPLSSNQQWGATFSADFGERYYYGTVQIREVGTTTILADANVSATLIVLSNEFELE